MSEIAVPLSGNERIVLEIASHGESMMPVGQWEGSVLSLAKRGLMERKDQFNYIISAAGHAALRVVKLEEDRTATDGARKLIEIHNHHVHARNEVETAAMALASAIRHTTKATGDSPSVALEKWWPVLKKRVLEEFEK